MLQLKHNHCRYRHYTTSLLSTVGVLAGVDGESIFARIASE